MAVEERIRSSDDIPESADFYECVEDTIEAEPSVEPAGTVAALAYVQLEDDALEDRMLEIKCLSELGKDIYDSSLTQRVRNVELLDIETRLAHKRWKDLYNFAEHKHLQKAIIKELQDKYSYCDTYVIVT
jgi:hypothetical protein